MDGKKDYNLQLFCVRIFLLFSKLYDINRSLDPSLLGRDSLKVIKLNWHDIFNINVKSTASGLSVDTQQKLQSVIDAKFSNQGWALLRVSRQGLS